MHEIENRWVKRERALSILGIWSIVRLFRIFDAAIGARGIAVVEKVWGLLWIRLALVGVQIFKAFW